MIGETRWCFLKHKTLQIGEEITFTFCTTTSKQNNCAVLCETTVLWTLDLIIFSGISTQFTEIQVRGLMSQTSWQCTRRLHTLTERRNMVECWYKNALRWFLLTGLQAGTLVTFTLCIVTSEITETVDAVTKTGLLILAEIRRGELITQMAVTGTGTETSRTCKQCTNDLWIYRGLQNSCFLKKMDHFLGWNVDVGSRQWRKWIIDFS